MVLLTLYMSTLTYWSFYFSIFFYFSTARIGYTFSSHYPTILNSLGHCICVHQGKVSPAAGFEPGTPWLWVNHATNELSWLYRPRDQSVFFQFEIIKNVLVSSLIWIPVLLVYGNYKYFNSFSSGTDFRRQILTSEVGPRAERVKSVAYKERS